MTSCCTMESMSLCTMASWISLWTPWVTYLVYYFRFSDSSSVVWPRDQCHRCLVKRFSLGGKELCHMTLPLVIGQELWMKKLKWEGLPGFNKLRWTALDDPASPGITGAFYKSYKNFAFYWILRAGHMVGH